MLIRRFSRFPPSGVRLRAADREAPLASAFGVRSFVGSTSLLPLLAITALLLAGWSCASNAPATATQTPPAADAASREAVDSGEPADTLGAQAPAPGSTIPIPQLIPPGPAGAPS